MLGQSLFPNSVRNNAGRIVQSEGSFILFPGAENGLRIMFGGKILKSMDEVSGYLANLYIATPGLASVHSSVLVLFLKPIRSGEAGKVIARIILVTEKIICVYMEMWGGHLNQPDKFTLRYVGVGFCVVSDKNGDGEMIKTLEPYREEAEITEYAEKLIELVRSLRRMILNAQ